MLAVGRGVAGARLAPGVTRDRARNRMEWRPARVGPAIAIGGAVESESASLAIAAAGAVLFLASDSMLAIDRFRLPFKAAQALVLSTYWLGQWLIALSARLGDSII